MTHQLYPLETNFSEILVTINQFSLKKMQLNSHLQNISHFCLGFNMLIISISSPFPDNIIQFIWHVDYVIEITIHVTLVAITETSIPMPYLEHIKSLQLICRSGTRRFHLRVPDLQNELQRLDCMSGCQNNSSHNGYWGDTPYWFFFFFLIICDLNPIFQVTSALRVITARRAVWLVQDALRVPSSTTQGLNQWPRVSAVSRGHTALERVMPSPWGCAHRGTTAHRAWWSLHQHSTSVLQVSTYG